MRVALLLSCVLGACAGPGAERAPLQAGPKAGESAANGPRAGDGGLAELARGLPAGADRCVLAQPSRIAPARREGVVRVSQAEPLAWLPELQVSAYALASRERRDGPRAQVVLARIGVQAAAARELLERRAQQRLEWSEQPCQELACGPRARFVADGVLRIEQGAFPEGADAGAEAGCTRMLERTPDALEVAVTRNRSFDDLPLRASTTLHASESALHLRRVELMPSIEAASQAARVAPQLAPPYATSVRSDAVDSEVSTEYEVRFEDLALAEQDDARMRSAALEADAREQSSEAPPEGSAPRTREDLLAQLGYRLERASKLGEPDKRAELLVCRALLERARVAQPDDEGLAALLAELLVTELREPATARAVLAPFLRAGPAGRRVSSLTRQAAALEGEAVLARELVAQALAPRATATALARAILVRMQAGVSYAEAEQAALAEAQPKAPAVAPPPPPR